MVKNKLVQVFFVILVLFSNVTIWGNGTEEGLKKSSDPTNLSEHLTYTWWMPSDANTFYVESVPK